MVLLIAGAFGLVIVAGGVSRTQSEKSQHTQPLLRQLVPENPGQYLNVGESLAAIAIDDHDRLIASQVLVLGINLANRRGDGMLSASMCIALASIEHDANTAESIWDYAALLDPTRISAWRTHREDRRAELAGLREAAARCLYAIRFDDYQLAAALFEQDGVRATIRIAAIEAQLDDGKIDQLLARSLADGSNDSCRGNVFIIQRAQGQVRRLVCPDHLRPVGTANNDDTLRQLIELELRLLPKTRGSSESMSWRTSEYVGLSTPQHDPSLSDFARLYGVDLTRPYWKSGRWSASP